MRLEPPPPHKVGLIQDGYINIWGQVKLNTMQNSNKNDRAVQAPFGGLGASWRSQGQCTCGGTLTVKYEYATDRSIKLRIKPNKGRFNLYSRTWNEWDKPLTDLQSILAAHGLN